MRGQVFGGVDGVGEVDSLKELKIGAMVCLI